jgi:hypothetical protein
VVPECRPVENARVTALELWGRWVGQGWTYEVEGASGFRQNEMRLTTVDRRTTRQLDLRTTGEGGQALLAPSFAGGRVAWYQTCVGDPDGCHGARRYTIRDGTYAVAVEGERLSGWAWDGRVQHRSSTDFSRTEPCGTNRPDGTVTPCALVRAPEPDWQPTAPWVPRG